ncbi:MAG: BatA domain-containing protein [Planctomycetes bacterium]|nr:BatA domain-containing protein [Planctomycetota bacterium]
MWGAELFLLGTLTAAIPVLIHLLARRKSLPVYWPALRFLLESHRKTARRRKIEQVLLMLLRAGILFLLAIGLARPIIRYASGALAGGTVVIVIDNTMSMGAEEEARSSLGEGLTYAQKALDGVPDSAFVGVVPVVKDPTLGLTGLGKGVETARACLRVVKPVPGRASLAAAMNEALRLVKSMGAAHQEVLVVTDLQRNAFPVQGEITEKAPAAVLTVVNTGRHSPVNATVEDISAFMPVAAPGGDLSVTGIIVNTSSTTVKTIAALEVDGARRSTQEVTVNAGGRTEASFSTRLETAGLHLLTIAIAKDALEGDNVRHAAVFVPQVLRTLVATAQDDPGGQSPAFFIRCALNPSSVAGDSAGSIVVDECNMLELGVRDLDQYAAVLVNSDLDALDDHAGRNLERYLDCKGTVVFFAAGEPMKIPQPDSLAFSQSLLADPLIRRLPGIDMGPFRSVRIYATSEIPVAPGDEVVLKTAQQARPVLVRKAAKGGGEYVFALSADPEWSNLVLRGVFPLLLQQMVYSSERAGGAVACRAVAGENVHVPVAAESSYDLVAPSGRIERMHTVGGNLDTGALLETGVYKILPAGGDELAAYVTVNPPGPEGDLNAIRPDTVAERIRGAAGSIFTVTGESELNNALTLSRKGLPVYDYILALVVAMAVFETFFASRITPADDRKRTGKHVPPSDDLKAKSAAPLRPE